MEAGAGLGHLSLCDGFELLAGGRRLVCAAASIPVRVELIEGFYAKSGGKSINFILINGWFPGSGLSGLLYEYGIYNSTGLYSTEAFPSPLPNRVGIIKRRLLL